MTYTLVRSFCLTVFVVQIFAHFVQGSIKEDEDRVNSEGMWKILSPRVKTPISTENRNSGLDLSGILMAGGLQQGANVLGLVIFPILLPLMVLFGVIVFIMSLFGTATSAITTGRRFDSNAGYNDIQNISNVIIGSEECIERIRCELIQTSSDDSLSSKFIKVFKAVNPLQNYRDKINNDGQKLNGCSGYKCNFKNFIFQALGFSS